LLTTVNVPHFGGSSATGRLRDYLDNSVDAEHASEGGYSSAADSRQSLETPFEWTSKNESLEVKLRLRVFERNTTSLFGVGQIDRIPAKTILAAAKIQESDGEVSGRASVLPDGRLGRFGWRANKASLRDFVEQACVAEMGLQTKDLPQPVDPMRPSSSRHSGVDIREGEVDNLSVFLSSLPSPSTRAIASGGNAQRGQQVFASVGCAKCHTQNLGSASNIYSDLLLHDMGGSLYDFAAAEPEIASQRVTVESESVGSYTDSYYGSPVTLNDIVPFETSNRVPQNFDFERQSPRTSPGEDVKVLKEGQLQERRFRGPTEVKVLVTRPKLQAKRRLNPTAVTQEWRTPPLWGVADSAPYMHDGRAETLLEAIAMHGGEGQASRDRFMQLSIEDRMAVLAFMESMVAPRQDLAMR
ncbi:MAG: di-heme oxidoredictase family protein, partial [Planctomycetota bacterium]